MTKANKLRAAMLGVQGHSSNQTAAPEAAPHPVESEKRTFPSRIGKRAVTGFVRQEAYRQLHLIALDKDCSIQDLVVEAFNDLFRKYDKSAIA
jgi:hypothetical protein